MRRDRLLLPVLCVLSGLFLLALFLRAPDYDGDIIKTLLSIDDADDDFLMDNSSRLERRVYPKRTNFSECKPLLGRVGIFVGYMQRSMKGHYKVAQATLQCYLKSVNYTLYMVDLFNDRRVKRACWKNKQIFFRKHCAASVYLRDVDWLVVLDADTGVVNPNHCIEEWIDTRVDLMFYERFFNWEIASGNYIVARNSEFSRKFLRKWGDWEFIQPSNFNGADNGVLQMHLLQTLIPSAVAEIQTCDAIWRATRLWPGKVRIYRRAHGWVRDGFLTSDSWYAADFMIHGWKAQNISDNGWKSPFKKIPNPAKCNASMSGWKYRDANKFNVTARGLPYLQYPEIGNCYPHCDDRV